MTQTLGGNRRPSRRWQKPLQRRWFVVLGCLLLGVAVAFLVSSRTPSLYVAEAVVVVPAIGPNQDPPGSPDAAARLATNYATLIPLDDAVMNAAAKAASVPVDDLRDALTVGNDPGTALIRIEAVFTDAIVAVDSAAAVASTVTRSVPPGQIARGSLKLVTVPSEATRVGESGSSSLVIGALLGLIIGLFAAFALERSDRRVDTVEDLAELLGTPATAWATVTPTEARALAYRWRALSGVAVPEVAVVATAPMTRDDVKHLLASLGPDAAGEDAGASPVPGPVASSPSQDIVRGRTDDSGDIGVVAVGAAGSGDGAELRAQMSDLVVMVVREGTRVSVVRDNVVRLGEYGVVVVWALLAPRHLPAKVGTAGTVNLSDRAGSRP